MRLPSELKGAGQTFHRVERAATTEFVHGVPSTFALRLAMSVRREIESECWEINQIARSQVGTEAEARPL